jgi:hypothetical protein
MSPLDAAWFVLKAHPVSPSGKEYSPPELQQLRAFVHANIESPDPELQAQAKQILEELTTAMSYSGGRTGLPTTPSGEEGQNIAVAPAVPAAADVAVRGSELPQEVRREIDEE